MIIDSIKIKEININSKITFFLWFLNLTKYFNNYKYIHS